MAERHCGVWALGLSRAPYAAQVKPSTGSPDSSHDQALDLGFADTQARLLWAEDAYFFEVTENEKTTIQALWELVQMIHACGRPIAIARKRKYFNCIKLLHLF